MIIAHSDGGARGNPGPAAIGIVFREGDEIVGKYSEKLKGKLTNNVAEYWGLIKTLEIALKYNYKELTCCLDSELVVKQLLGEYQVKNKKLLELFLKVQKLQENFDKIIYKHVKRKDPFQKTADYLLNQELDKELGVEKK
ncbi:MAG: ribonuclease HI family protein [Candidatus Pacearchaeota archaeon]|jgi:ribonuclease HI